MDIARVCSENTVCTDCPAREACNARKMFYNKEAFSFALLYAFESFLKEGYSVEDSMAELSKMNIKCDEEHRIHPNYSPK